MLKYKHTLNLPVSRQAVLVLFQHLPLKSSSQYNPLSSKVNSVYTRKNQLSSKVTLVYTRINPLSSKVNSVNTRKNQVYIFSITTCEVGAIISYHTTSPPDAACIINLFLS
jgi:hypothetical protein